MNVDFDGVRVTRPQDDSSRSCPAAISTTDHEERLEIQNNELAVWYAPAHYMATYGACDTKGNGYNPITLGSEAKCARDTCGVTSCALTRGQSLDPKLAWTRADNTLSVHTGRAQNGEAIITKLGYCVTGNQMVIRADDGTVVTFKRFTGSGTPVPCAQRAAAKCASPNSTCHVGQCTGSASCTSAKDVPTCTARQGCTWEDKTCLGETNETCTFESYGNEPGCAL